MKRLTIPLIAIATISLLAVLLITRLTLPRLSGLVRIDVAGTSMEPTIMLGDHIVVDSFAYDSRPLRRGDIVLMTLMPSRNSLSSGKPIISVSRVIALAGDKVRIKKGIGVFVNGKLLKEPYVSGLPDHDFPTGTSKLYKVPPGQCFTMSDNRQLQWYETKPLSSIRGKVISIYWPAQRSGRVR